MAPIDDDTLDRLLGRHLSSRLDGQLGRAKAAFQRSQAAAPSNESAPAMRLVDDGEPRRPARARWSMPWLVGVAGLATAAGVAAVFLIPGLRPSDPGTGGQVAVTTNPSPAPGDNTARRNSSAQPAVRYVHNRSWDEGTQTNENGQPVRRVRHQQVERIRWYDAERGAYVEMTVPRENVELYELDPY